MTILTPLLTAVSFAVAASAFAPATTKPRSCASTRLSMATVMPDSGAVVGVTGGGFISLLCAKIAALSGYKTWILTDANQRDTVLPLLGESVPDNLELLNDTGEMDDRLPETDAVLIALDAPMVIQPNGLNYLFQRCCGDPGEGGPKLKRVVAMSRNLNGNGMGFFATAARKAANQELWDNAEANDYKAFEALLKKNCQQYGVDFTIARAGTLKGGACGNGEYPQYLSQSFYDMNKMDVVMWRPLFDCNVRGVKLAKGDVMPGPGFQAALTATGTEEHDGDTSRCSLADAMVQSLRFENTANIDFGVGTKLGREPPTQEEWNALFAAL